MKLPPRTPQVLTYAGAAACAAILVAGALAAFFESATVVRIYGALTALAALAVGYFAGKRAWLMQPGGDDSGLSAVTVPLSTPPSGGAPQG